MIILDNQRKFATFSVDQIQPDLIQLHHTQGLKSRTCGHM